MPQPRAAMLTLAALLLAPGCGWGPDTGPSEGLCTGAMGTLPADGVIDAQESEFHLVGETFQVQLSYLNGALQASGATDGVFTASDHTFDLTGTSATWAFEEPQARPGLTAGAVTVEHVTPYRLTGSLEVQNDDGTCLRCTFDLRRAIEREADPGS